MTALALPKRARGRPTADAEARYQAELGAFCKAIIKIRSTLDFDVSARGWCYMLEEHGLLKGDFDAAQSLIADCRKSGRLPIDIVAEDAGREFENLEFIDDTTPEQEAADIVERMQEAHANYNPVSFGTISRSTSKCLSRRSISNPCSVQSAGNITFRSPTLAGGQISTPAPQ
jgi:hypothetical protein